MRKFEKNLPRTTRTNTNGRRRVHTKSTKGEEGAPWACRREQNSLSNLNKKNPV